MIARSQGEGTKEGREKRSKGSQESSREEGRKDSDTIIYVPGTILYLNLRNILTLTLNPNEHIFRNRVVRVKARAKYSSTYTRSQR